MQIHEQNSFKVETPFAMQFEHNQDFTPSYLGPMVVKDSTPIPRKRFFRQLLDLPKDMQEMRVSQRSIKENVQEVERDLNQFEMRVEESERKTSGLQDQIDSLSKRSSTYQDRVENLSYSVDPLVGQVADLKKQNLQIHALSKSLQTTKLAIGILLMTNLVLIGLFFKSKILHILGM